MAETLTIARPYARAVFQLASESNKLDHWSDMLSAFAQASTNSEFAALIDNPKVDQAKVIEALLELAKAGSDTLGRNLLNTLAENNRLSILAEISINFEHLRAEAQKTISAELISAVPVDSAVQKSIVDALKAKLGREVDMSTEVDENLIGGAIIKAGDMVIDGSVSGQLERLNLSIASK